MNASPLFTILLQTKTWLRWLAVYFWASLYAFIKQGRKKTAMKSNENNTVALCDCPQSYLCSSVFMWPWGERGIGCKRDVCDLHLFLSLSQCQSLRVLQIYNDASHEAETPQWTPPILCSSCIHSWCNIVLLRTQTNHVVCCAQVLGLKKKIITIF